MANFHCHQEEKLYNSSDNLSQNSDDINIWYSKPLAINSIILLCGWSTILYNSSDKIEEINYRLLHSVLTQNKF